MFVVWYLVGIVCVLASQAVLAAAFVGIGLLIRRAFGLTSFDLDVCFVAFWMGFCAIILLLLLWNFVFPVTAVLLLLVLLLGAVGLFISRGELDALRKDPVWRSNGAWKLAFVLAAVYVANQGLGGLTYSDSALYHLQAVEWNKTYRLVPGLANLYGPLGFNNASLLYGAMLDTGPWAGLGHRLANGLLLQALLLRVVIALTRISSGGRRASAHEVFIAVLLPAALSLSLFGRLSGHATAPPTAILLLVVAERLYALLATQPRGAKDAAYDVFSITTMSAVAVTIKVSALFFALLAAAVALCVWMYRRPASDATLRRTLTWTLGAGLLIGGSWMARSVVLSGYPLFPSRVAAAPVDWRAPEEHADAEYALAAHSSKASTMLNEVVAGRDRWGYLPRWFRVTVHEPFDFFVPLLLAVLAGFAAAVEARRPPPKRRVDTRAPRWLLLPIGVALGVWFVVAPEGRYAIGFAWALAALSIAEAWRLRLSRTPEPNGRNVLLGVGAMAAITLVVAPVLVIPWDSPGFVAKTIIKENVRVFDSRGWYQRPPPPKLEPFRTASGLVVGVPSDRCWNAPVPCTPNPAATLELRDPTNLRSGFRVRGAWTMQDWPFKSRPNFLRAWRESRGR